VARTRTSGTPDISPAAPAHALLPVVPAITLAAPRLLPLAGGTLLMSLAAWVYELTGQRDNPLAAVFVLLAFAAAVALLLRAGRAQPSRHTLAHDTLTIARRPFAVRLANRFIARLAAPAIIAAILLSGLATLALAGTVALSAAGSPRLYNSDAAAFNHYNADLVRNGVNPYTSDDRFWDAVARFPDAGATPLRLGRYAGERLGPSLDTVVRDTHAELANPALRGPEYAPASLHSYPALAFLVYLPGDWASLPTTFLTSLFVLLAFLAIVLWTAPARLRPALAVVLLANTFLVVYTLRGSFEVIALLPALLAWRGLERLEKPGTHGSGARGSGARGAPLQAGWLGLACAVKQTVWPLVPLYAIIVWRRQGARAALAHLGIAAGAFLLPNLPFIIASPGAWAASMVLPLTLPIFPSGMGLVALGRAGVLPLLPPVAYAALELLALAAVTLWYATARTLPPPALALLLALLPFTLAWHSLFAYVIALPALAVYATATKWNEISIFAPAIP
jgi:hypothetical protein